MDIRLKEKKVKETVEMRTVYAQTLLELAQINEDIVVVEADLMGCDGTRSFSAVFPDRTINCGIQEANMIGVAAGLSLAGKIPFAHSFAAFASRRAYDQTFISAAYAKLNVKIVGSDPGITAALNGGTHMPFEDMGIMCSIPGMTAVEPVDSVMLRSVFKQAAASYGTHYIRLLRKNAIGIYREGTEFKIGKAAVLREGRDVTIISSGYCVAEALKACKALCALGIDAGLIDMFTWKPIDAAAIVSAAKRTGAVVTAENHNVRGGLGSAVAEVLVQNCPVVQELVGVQDVFGEVGPVDDLAERFQLTEPHIVRAVQKALARKNCRTGGGA